MDIFSNKKAQAVKPFVTVDFREKNSLVPSFLIKNNCVVQFDTLIFGDYIAGDCIIERKTFRDLQSSILDRRIFHQISGLKEHRKKLIIIEGSKADLRMHPAAINGFIISAVLDGRVPIVFSANEEETAQHIRIIVNKRASRTISLRPSAHAYSAQKQALFILEGFEGIGPKAAVRLLNHFRTLHAAFNSSLEELLPVIGNRAYKFHKIINETYMDKL